MPALAAVQSSYAFVSYAHLEQAVQRELAALAAIEAVRRSACRWRGSRSPWGHADGPGRMAPRQGPRRARQSHAGAAAGPSARIEPGREHLAISARQLVVAPRVRLLPRPRRSLLRRLEPPHRPALAHHVHRPPGLGQCIQCMMISAGWY